ncbi:ABC transporter ATP-binding protein [Paenibacillus glucanolyticus]|jgi:ATP-binding cassette subfamily B protein|uniref:Multidrug ABC transporter ATP-binding protein n=1 Tax=Paenibacillus glucanolyticus TaxID=59843 RepID=A0A163LK11_9BACL|nr:MULTISPECIES: ABC transporter ATP-binding protein [Paenibacillus]ANA82110.1 multidrug ABC transporter ATP-binding protein [Paenibacillus glucanolyticus]AVV59152.1 ABC transporter ATP-binding protein [Paenibacillus glucanolyticus]AWP28323.1 multidrug ABC transporter ATP-binding protein [Paenibacillus sp. Cedars]ETT43556.1 ABC transporter-like protein [Paenibacillus sp. FSL R5-808]KZS48194.1 multidrug ABC transporter ATP-binding protein [Paenibacillus glucanolyticus]
MNVLRQLQGFFWEKRSYLFLSMLCLAIATALGLVYPQLLKVLIDDAIKLENYGIVPQLALTVLGVVILKAFMQFLHGFFGGRLGNYLAYSLRNACYEKLQFLSFRYYDTARTGDLMSRLTGDLEAIRMFIGFGFAQLLNLVLMVTFGSIMMFTISWQLTLVTLVAMPFLVVAALKFESRIHPAFQEMRLALSSLTTAVQENITGVRTVKSFAREPHEVEKFSERNERYKTNQIFASSLWARYFPMMELFANISVVILLAVGGGMVIKGSMTVGELAAFFTLIWYIIGPLWGIGFHINNYTQSKASGERVLELLNQPIDVEDRERAVDLVPSEVKGHVVFDNVTFAYGNKMAAVKDINLDARPGSVIGLLGGTGSGKSTIIQLLMHAYNVNQGSIKLDGVNINDIKVRSLRGQIATVFQETFLFSSSIRNNISYGMKNVSMEEIIRVAKLAKAHEFIMEMKDGYDTIVGERGMGLSGGQKQRIAIARALLKDPKILILDDATSAVDMETEHEIQSGFQEVMNGRTTFIIAHRISSLRHADEILVLDEGSVVQRGKHNDLIAVPGPYQDVYKIQYADLIAKQAQSGGTQGQVQA